MGCRQRIYFTDSRKAEIWDRRQPGESMRSIGRGFDRNSSSIFPLLSRTGGIRPLAHTRSRPALTHCDREEISRGLGAQLSFRAITRQLRRAPWTISRAVERNGGRAGYRAARSDQAARDRGKELADHKRLTLATDLEVCFCDPHSPRQRGTNENTNRLLRQYFPKGTGLSMHSRTKPDAVARELNERRRKTLNHHAPDEKFTECVAAIR